MSIILFARMLFLQKQKIMWRVDINIQQHVFRKHVKGRDKATKSDPASIIILLFQGCIFTTCACRFDALVSL